MRPALLRIAPLALLVACIPPTPEWVGGDAVFPQLEPVPPSGPMPAPISGGTLALTSDGRVGVVSDPNADSVWIVERAGSSVSTVPVAFEEGAEPGRVAIENDQRAHVVLRGAGAVATIDLASKQLEGRIAVCPEPRGLAWDNLQGRVHVACADGQLVSFIPRSPASLQRVQLDGDLRDVVVTADGLWVSRFRSAEVLHVRDGVMVLRRSLPLVTVMDGASQTTYAPSVAWRMVALDNGELAIAHQGARIDPPIDLGGTASAFDAGTAGTGESPYGSPSPSGISCSGAVRSFVTTLDLSSGAMSTTALRGALPVDVADGPDFQVLVATAGERTAELVSRNTTQSTTVPCEAFEGAFPSDSALIPVAVAYHRASSLLVVQEETPDGQLVQVTFDDGAIVTRVPLFEPRAFDQGRALFHLATRGNSLACASCHPEATEDGRVWDFVPIGARRTQALRGGIIGRAPYHWEGNLPTFEALMTEVFGRRMGATSFTANEATQLAAWLDSVPALKTGPAGEAAQRGRNIFMSSEAGCASCHSGPLFTSGATVNIGTGGTFKVPSLVGLGLRAPYMHDGCAATLADRFSPIRDCGGGDLHGNTGQLTVEQISDLTAYITTL
jgi:hypothetical protein